MGYDCGKVTFSTSDSKSGPWKTLVSGKPTDNIDLGKKNQRYIRLEFDEVDSGYVGVQQVQVRIVEGDEAPKPEPTKSYQEVADKVRCVDNSKTYDGYPLENMYNDSSDYWCSESGDDVFLTFDCGTNAAKIAQWQMVMGYDCNKVTFSTSDDKRGPWTTMTSGRPDQKIDLDGKNKRYIRLQFDELQSSYVGVQQIFVRVLEGDEVPKPADDAPAADEKKEAEPEPVAQEAEEPAAGGAAPATGAGGDMADENEADFDVADDAEDITLNEQLKCIDSYPKQDDLATQAQAAHSGSAYEMMTLSEYEATKDVWIKYDVGTLKIDTLEVGFYEALHASTVKIYTSKAEDGHYELIKIKRNLPKKEEKTFFLKSKHERYIKIAIADRTSGTASINKVKFNGFEPKVSSAPGAVGGIVEFTSNVSVYQASAKKESAPNVLKNNADVLAFERGATAWIIFDCMRYELDRIVITFEPKCVPMLVKFKMSDVAPRYSFNIPSSKKFNLDSCFKPQHDAAWNKVKQVQTLQIDESCYTQDGFKRYIMLEFSKFYVDELKVRRIQFFGQLSTRIPDDDEQFQVRFDGDGSEAKKDDSTPYKPDVVDNSPTQQGMPIANIWKPEDHFFWMGQYGTDPYITLDTGNNKVESILVKAYPSYTYKTLKISTGDKPKSKNGWTLLVQDDEMTSKMTDGGTYDLTKYEVKKYIKLEFFEFGMQVFGLSSVKLYGPGEFLDHKESKLSMEDIKNMKFKDQDLVQKYIDQMQKDHIAVITQMAVQASQAKPVLGDQWMDLKRKYYDAQGKMLWAYTEPYAYLADTDYERDQILMAMQKQKEECAQFTKEQLDNEVAMEKKLAKVGEDYKAQGEIRTQWSEELQAHQKEWHKKIFSIWQDPKAKLIWQEWKNAVKTNPRQISSAFTVAEYDNCITQYAMRNDEDGLRECFGILADLFDQSMEQEKEMLHKFFVYQLNSNYLYQTYARSFSYGIPPVSIVVDAASQKGKVDAIAFRVSATQAQKIVISTADELREVKQQSEDADDDETEIDYSNFNIIGQLDLSKFDPKKRKGEDGGEGLSLDETKVKIDRKNQRYIRVEFGDWEEKANWCSLQCKRMKFFGTDQSGVKIVTATKSTGGQDAENVLKEDDYSMYYTYAIGKNHKEAIEDRIRDKVCEGVNYLRKSRGGKISKHDKHFVKFLLCFQNERNYAEMLYSAKLVMGLLRKPLDIEYKRLQDTNAGILTLALDPQYRCDKSFRSNHQCLEWDYNKWYKPRNAMFWPQDLKPLADEWTKLGLNLTDPEFKQLRRTSSFEPDKSFVSSDDLAMEYLNLIAYKLDSGFQKAMKELFKQNREKMGRSYPTGNADLDVQSGPVKTKARQKIKVDLKYYVQPAPQCMAVLDIVRCGIVCEDSEELCSLYQLIMERFKGNIMRVKNAFDDIKKGDDSHGYRAVMINIKFGDESLLPKGYEMVCEAQLLLNAYYQVRKDMHLGYGITRSEDGGQGKDTKPFVVLARDCAKFGALDI